MKKRFDIFFAFAILFVTLTACKEDITYPLEPEIRFVSFEAFGPDSGQLIIHFQDGDGDIGLSQSDSGFNAFFTYSEKTDSGTWFDYELGELGFNYRIPLLLEEGEEAISGEIEIDMVRSYFVSDTAISDTFRWSGYIVDQAMNQSNTMVSDAYVKP